MAIPLSGRAGQENKYLLQEAGVVESGLRIWVAGSGWSGLQYQMAIDDGHSEYGEDVFWGGFKIDNPNAIAICGSSFQTEDEMGIPDAGCYGCR